MKINKTIRFNLYNKLLDKLIEIKLNQNIIPTVSEDGFDIVGYCSLTGGYTMSYLTELQNLKPITLYNWRGEVTEELNQFWFKPNDVDSRIKLLCKILYKYE